MKYVYIYTSTLARFRRKENKSINRVGRKQYQFVSRFVWFCQAYIRYCNGFFW